jgi:hypothetical protein
VKESLAACKEWLSQQTITDLNSQRDIARLLDLGKSLKLKLADFVELKSFY